MMFALVVATKNSKNVVERVNLRQGNAMTKIIQITDCHLLRDESELFCGISPDAHLKKILAMAASENPDLLLLTGDLSQDGTDEAYQRLLQYLNVINCPIYFIPGNHDDSDICNENLITNNIHRETVLALGNWQLIFLDSVVPEKTEGFLKQDQLDLLETHLQTDKQTIVCMHHHPLQINPFMDRYIVKNYQDFLAFVADKPTVKLVLFGHIHADFHKKMQHIDFYGCPSTSVQFSPVATSDNAFLDLKTPGFRVLQLKADGFETSVVRLDAAIYSA